MCSMQAKYMEAKTLKPMSNKQKQKNGPTANMLVAEAAQW